MDDSLFKAADDAKEQTGKPSQVLHEHTDRVQHITELVERLRDQALAAVRGEFFDEGIDEEIQPTRSLMRTEAKAVILMANRRQPPYRVRIEFGVRTDREDHGLGGSYEVRGKGDVWCASATQSHSSFEIVPAIQPDGLLDLDEHQLREKIASAIRILGKVPEG